MGPDYREQFVTIMADAYAAVLVVHEMYDLDAHIAANIESNLKDCTLISLDQAAELEAWFAL